MKNVIFRSVIVALIGLSICFGAVFVTCVVRFESTLYIDDEDEYEERIIELAEEGIADRNDGVWEFDIGLAFGKSFAYSVIAGLATFAVAFLIFFARSRKNISAELSISIDEYYQYSSQKSNDAEPADAKQKEDALKSPKTNRVSPPVFGMTEIHYDCFSYFLAGFFISAIIYFFGFAALANLIKNGSNTDAINLFLLLGYLIDTEAEFEVGGLNIFTNAVSFGISVGVYCIVYAIYKGSKEYIMLLRNRTAQIYYAHEDRIASLEDKIYTDHRD